GIRIEAEVCAGQVPHHVFVGDEAGEEDVVLKAELDGLSLELLDAVAVANQDAIEAVALELVQQVAKGAKEIIQAILRIHRTQIAEDRAPHALQTRIRLDAPHALQVRAVPNDEDPLRLDAVPIDL